MHKYETVVKDLRERIRAGDYASGEQLPTIARLCDIYGVSETTVKRALAHLTTMGLVATRRGSGSYVKNNAAAFLKRAPSEMASQMMGFTKEKSVDGAETSTEVKVFEVVHPEPDVASALSMSEDGFCYHVVRVRYADGKPRCTEDMLMPIDVIPGIGMDVISGSIYSYIEDKLGLKIDSANRVVRAVMPDKQERAWLEIDGHTPLLQVEQIGFLDDGTPFEHSVSNHIGPSYEFYSVAIH